MINVHQTDEYKHLRAITGSTSQAVIPKIRILESNQLVEEDGHNYRLTLMGKILTSRIEDCILVFGVFLKFKDFWTKHHLEGIPEPLLNDIGDLLDSSIELIDAVIERLAQGIPVEVVINKDVFEKLYKEPYIEKYSEMMQFSNFKLMVTEEYVRVGTTVTENFLSFGLYKKDGMLFDLTEQIFSFDNKALGWGKKFFQYYKDRSKIVEIPKN